MNYRLHLPSIAFLALMLMALIAIQPYSYQSNTFVRVLGNSPSQSPIMAPSPFMGLSTEPFGMNVSVIGTIKTYKVSPVCSLANPPCAISDTVLYYVVVNGRNYRLIFPNSTQSAPNVGSYVVVTGFYVTPSTYQASEYIPLLEFYGDITVTTISYFSDFPR